MAHIIQIINYNQREDDILNQLIQYYVSLEDLSYDVEQPRKFYLLVQSIFEKERVLETIHKNDYIQSKELHEVRKRYFKNAKTVKETKDFHKYFYSKFLEEIKQERYKRTWNKYSTKQRW